MIKKLPVLAFIFIFLSGQLYPQQDNLSDNNLSENNNKEKIKKLILANVTFGAGIDSLSKNKVEAALSLAARLTMRYELIPAYVSDSVAAGMRKKTGEVTVLKLAREMGAKLLIFIDVNKFVNILRVDITSVATSNPDSANKSTGYALLRYKSNDKFLFDPTLMEAVQRAFIGIAKDSLIYSAQNGKMAVLPAPTLVVGGLYFINDKNLQLWELFKTKQTTSFDAVETIFRQALNSRRYVAFDMATRDSIYAMFNLYAVENYHPASTHEIDALSRFDVQYYITGTFKRNKQGAEIELILSEIIGGKLKAIRTEKSVLAEDNLDEFRERLSNLTSRLLNISD